jgi:hypothetical protein
VAKAAFHSQVILNGLLNAAKVMSSSQVELPNGCRSRTEREIAPQGLKPSSYWPLFGTTEVVP